VGFPLAVGFAWFFEVTPEGIKRTAPMSGGGALIKPQTTDFILGGALALVFVIGAAQLFWPRAPAPETQTAAAGDAKRAEADKPKVERPRLGDKSIAVLPFANLSPDKEDAYFADGLSEEILNALSQIRGLKVISRTSSFAFKGKNLPLREIASQLGVRYVLEGSVRRAGDDVRIAAQLIDVASDAHIWSKTFDPKFEQIFIAQREIARAIALAMEVEVDLTAAESPPTKNLEAYTLYLKGRELVRRANEDDYRQAIELLTRAIDLDPHFAQAHLLLAVRKINLVVADPVRFKEFIPEARKSAEAIRKLDPNSAGALAFLAIVDANELRWSEAVENVDRAVKLAPSNALVRMARGTVLMRIGLLDRAKQEFAEARGLDPLNSAIGVAATYCAFARGEDGFVLAAAKAIAGSTGEASIYSHWLQAFVAQRRGDSETADREFRAYIAARGTNKSIIEPVSRALKSAAAIPQAAQAIGAEKANDPSFRSTELLNLIDPAGAMIDELRSNLKSGDTYFVSFALPSVWRAIFDQGANDPTKLLLRNAGLVDYWKAHGWPDRCRAKGEDDFECS
jgi:TolB-like protein